MTLRCVWVYWDFALNCEIIDDDDHGKVSCKPDVSFESLIEEETSVCNSLQVVQPMWVQAR